MVAVDIPDAPDEPARSIARDIEVLFRDVDEDPPQEAPAEAPPQAERQRNEEVTQAEQNVTQQRDDAQSGLTQAQRDQIATNRQAAMNRRAALNNTTPEAIDMPTDGAGAAPADTMQPGLFELAFAAEQVVNDLATQT